MRKIIPSLLLFTMITLLFVSCEDDPSSIGGSLLPDDDKFKFDTLNTQITPLVQHSSFFKDQVDLATAVRIFLGKTAEVESKLLIRFKAVDDSLLVYIANDSLNVMEAWIEMYPQHTLGDAAAPFDFTIHNIEEEWLPFNFNNDSLLALPVGEANVITTKDLSSDSLYKVGIDNELITSWIQSAADSVAQNFGLLFKATNTTNRIEGFRAYTGTADEKTTVLKVKIEKPGGIIDTIDLGTVLDVHVPTGEFPTSTDDSIILQGGLTAKGKLFFDLTNAIPQNAAANSAKLILTIDTLNSFTNDNFDESIIYSILSDSATNEIASEYGTLQLTKEGDKYIDNNFVQFLNRWLNGVDNQGIRLRINNDISTLSRLKIFGSTADIAIRPKLIVTYSF